MPSRRSIPKQSDFPHSLAAVVEASTAAPVNVVIFLHGLGDSSSNFASFAKALNLPETLTVTLQGPSPLPPPLPQGYHWGDDILLDQSSGDLESDAGFAKARKLLVDDVIKSVLIDKCNFNPREIMIMGYGQGGMLALATAKDLGRDELGGVISIGGVLPTDARLVNSERSGTPVLLLGGSRGVFSTSTGTAVKSVEGTFKHVEHPAWQKPDDSMPKNREEALPMMTFFAKRLRSMSGIPEGAVEIS